MASLTQWTQEFEQTLGDSEGQGSLECCSPWGRKELDTTQPMNNNFLLLQGVNLKFHNFIISSTKKEWEKKMWLKIQITTKFPIFLLTIRSATHREKSLLKDDDYYNLTNEQKFHIMIYLWFMKSSQK